MTPLLAQRARADRAFERMYRRHAADVYRYALAVLRNPSDAEDVAQTTFMNAYRAFQRGERPRKPENWLIRIAHNVCRQRFRQTARRPNEVSFEEDVAETLPVDTDAPSARELTLALSRLAFNQRSALVLRELEGRSYAEIAETLGLTVSAVETLLFRARRALREQLEGGLSCRDAELAISRQLDKRLSGAERGALRAHLRECKDCAGFARSQRAQRAAWKGLAAIPLPSSLASFFGGGGASVGTGAASVGFGAAAKATALVATAALAGGVGYQGVKEGLASEKKAQPRAQEAPAPAPRRLSVAPRFVPTTVHTARVGTTTKQQTKPKTKAIRKAKQARTLRKTQRGPKSKGRVVAPLAFRPKTRGKAIRLAHRERAAQITAKPKKKPSLARETRLERKAKQKAKAKDKTRPVLTSKSKAAAAVDPKPEAKVKKADEPVQPTTAPSPNDKDNGGGKK